MRHLPRINRVAHVVACLAAAAFFIQIAPPASHAAPVVEEIVNFGPDTFVENVAELPDGRLAVTTSNGLYRVDPATKLHEKLYDAESLGGVAVHDDKVYFTVGNNFPATFGSTLSGSIHVFNLATSRVDQIASGIPAPNGLAILPNGTILYSTVWGGYEGVHEVGQEPSILYADVPSPNGLAVGPDGALYVGSTAGVQQVFKVDTDTLRVELTGVFTLFCDDLTVTAEGIFAASVVGIWAPGALLPVVSMDLLGMTSVKAGKDGSLFITKMNGVVLRLRF